ncbi:MAG: aromatic amino acid lyase, partial [Gemmatimonadota bacterium]
MVVIVDGSPLTVADVAAVAHRRANVEIGLDLAARMAPARALVESIIASNEVAYGITTGFGALSYTRIPPEQATELQYDLVRSHASGVGDLLKRPTVRAMLLLRARTLAQGYSGVRPAIVERLIEFLRRDLLPAVPDRGSVGASGDLAPFAHLALPL